MKPHTPSAWLYCPVSNGQIEMLEPDGWSIFTMTATENTTGASALEANAFRITACVNFCGDVDNQKIVGKSLAEIMQRHDDLLEILKSIVEDGWLGPSSNFARAKELIERIKP